MEKQQQIQAEFRKRRTRQFIAAVPVIGGAVVIAMAKNRQEMANSWPVIVALFVILAALGFSLYNWRCPACHSYLGKSISPSYCPRCGVALGKK